MQVWTLWYIPVSDEVSRLGLGLETCLETRFLESRSRMSQVSSRHFAWVIFYEALQEGVP